MQLPVYIGYDTFKQVGTLTIQSNRIIYADIFFSTPVSIGYVEKQVLYIQEGKPLPTNDYKINQATQYPFALKKLSTADFAYRNKKLTHEIISNGLINYLDTKTKFFIKPSFAQKLTLSYNLKKFFWQTQEFKTHIYKYVATSFISLAIGIIGTLLVVKPGDKTNTTTPINDTLSKQQGTPITNDTQVHQPIHKTKTP